jgi:AraC-like DNA-binding protein
MAWFTRCSRSCDRRVARYPGLVIGGLVVSTADGGLGTGNGLGGGAIVAMMLGPIDMGTTRFGLPIGLSPASTQSDHNYGVGMRPREDAVRYSRYDGLDGLEVVSARWVEHSFAPHMHDFYAVSLNYGGRGAFACRGQLRHATPGTCNLIAPGELHTGNAISGHFWIYRNLYIESGLMAALLRGIEWHGRPDVRFKAPLARDPTLAGRLARAFASLTQPTALLQNESLLLSVVARLAAEHIEPGHAGPFPGGDHAAVRRVREWLDANSEQNVSIHGLAGLAGLSPYYLVRAFHRHMGVPPHRYQTIVRVHQARRLLLAGEAIPEAARRAGFCDQSHLNRCFKRVLGITPGKYAPASRSRQRRSHGSPPADRRHLPVASDD